MRRFINKIKRAVRDILPRNLILNRVIEPVQLETLHTIQSIDIERLDINVDEYQNWINYFIPDWIKEYKSIYNKKLFEFFTSHKILDPTEEDVFCDAAGGRDAYLHKINCRKKIIHDLSISEKLKNKTGEGIEFVESDVGNIPLPDNSLNKISCHHSFEHFQKDSDILFILEIQRLLKVQGKCCIIPLFVANRYVEVTNKTSMKLKFDPESHRIFDPTSTIPGARASGNFARIYDLNSFADRVVSKIDFKRFNATVYELKLNGAPVPDLTLDCHIKVAKINRPYRAMVISRFS